MNSSIVEFIKLGYQSHNCDSYTLWAERLINRNPLEVIIPIYNMTDEVMDILSNKIFHDLVNKFIVIDDRGPLDDCDYKLADLKKTMGDYLLVIKNERNMGFVYSVNRGLSATNPRSDVIILNSDAKISHETVDRLIVSAYSFANVATVVPLSNNNGYFSVDMSYFKDKSIDVSTINQSLSFLPYCMHEPVPVNNGFCLYITRKCIESVGLLDKFLYKRGYAEETDLCLRATEKGLLNLISFNSFGLHDAGFSFGLEKNSLKQVNGRILNCCYPYFREDLQRYEKYSIFKNFVAPNITNIFNMCEEKYMKLNKMTIDLDKSSSSIFSLSDQEIIINSALEQEFDLFNFSLYLILKIRPKILSDNFRKKFGDQRYDKMNKLIILDGNFYDLRSR